MPIYAIQCDSCGHTTDVYRSLANMNDLPECCGVKMHRMVTAPMILPDIQPYRSMIDGSMITSRSQHKKHLKAHGCVEIGNEKLKPKPFMPPSRKELAEDLRKVAYPILSRDRK